MRIAALVLALGCSFLACERGDDVQPPSTERSPVERSALCDLLTEREVERVTKERVEKSGVERSHSPGVWLCVYKLGERWGSIAVGRTYEDAEQEWERFYERERINMELVDGVGDRAMIHGKASIHVVEGRDGFGIQVQYGAQKGTERVLKSLARLAVRRI